MLNTENSSYLHIQSPLKVVVAGKLWCQLTQNIPDLFPVIKVQLKQQLVQFIWESQNMNGILEVCLRNLEVTI